MRFDYDEYDEYNGYGDDLQNNLKYDYQYETDDEEDEDISQDLSIDKDLAGYFSDARVSTKSKSSTNKKKVKKITYKTGTKVLINKKEEGTIIYGPYESNKKQMYEVELANGDLISIDDKHMQPQQ